MDGMLTQEEIDALTGDGASNNDSASISSEVSDGLTDAERDAVGEIANINMGTAATTLSTLLNNKVTLSQFFAKMNGNMSNKTTMTESKSVIK